ncbi:MAG: zinc ABC transporter substrate-binding protein [Phycisphaeraceae bacterium]|nr:zinc ABC transporter substrate-binding protein [Phycisphaeraceae bacterium]MCW5763206.1 zinc ABC transporter substrate-binding protein [Phycisphaeraceae bacterium]
MIDRRTVLSGLLVAGSLAMLSCSKPAPSDVQKEPESAASSTGVVTTFYPTQYWAERIAGGKVEVRCFLPDDEDPASWRPDRSAMEAMQSASLIIVNGASFEEWVGTAPLPRSRIVDTTARLTSPLIVHANAVTHSHGPGGEHSHEGIDGHTWLDPINAIEQSQAILEAMVDTWPEHDAEFRRNAGELRRDLIELNASLESLASKMASVIIVASHPSYNYIGRRYGWEVINLGIEPDDVLTSHDWEHVEEDLAATSDKHLIVLWEDEPSEANARGFAQRFGARSVVFRPCESRPERGDYLSVMRENIEALAQVLE